MTKTTAINVLNQDALPEMTRKKLYVVNVRELYAELYISFARNFRRRINLICSTPKIIVNTFVSVVLTRAPVEFQQLFNKQEERFFEKCQRDDGISVAEDFTLFERSMIQEWTKKVKAKIEKKNQMTPNTFGEFEEVHPKGSI